MTSPAKTQKSRKLAPTNLDDCTVYVYICGEFKRYSGDIYSVNIKMFPKGFKRLCRKIYTCVFACLVQIFASTSIQITYSCIWANRSVMHSSSPNLGLLLKLYLLIINYRDNILPGWMRQMSECLISLMTLKGDNVFLFSSELKNSNKKFSK